MSQVQHQLVQENELREQQRLQALDVRSVKKMQSILPDHLEAIEEASEEEALFEINSFSSDESSNSPRGDVTTGSERRDDTASSSFESQQQYLPPAYNTITPERSSMRPNTKTINRIRKESVAATQDKKSLSGRINSSTTVFVEECDEEVESRKTAKTEHDDSTTGSEEKDEINLQTGGSLLSSLSSSSSSRKSNASEEDKERIDHLSLWGSVRLSAHASTSNFDYDNEFQDIDEFTLNKNSRSSRSNDSNARTKTSITDMLDSSQYMLDSSQLSFAQEADGDNSETDYESEGEVRAQKYNGQHEQDSNERDGFNKAKSHNGDVSRGLLYERNNNLSDEISQSSEDSQYEEVDNYEEADEQNVLNYDYPTRNNNNPKRRVNETSVNTNEKIRGKTQSNGQNANNYLSPRQNRKGKIMKVRPGNKTHLIEEEIPWRLDPSESLSDWILLVRNQTSDEIQTYHVHKNFLALGQRKSEYFLGIFKNHDPSFSPNMTEIELLQSAADVVPDVLDYIYADRIVFSSKTALGIRFLSQCLGIKILYQNVMKFIQQDLTIDTAVIYYITSTQLGDQKVRGITSRHCARNITKIDSNHALLKYMDPYFFSSVLMYISNDGATEKRRIHASSLLADYCSLHKNVLTHELFVMLTDEDHVQLLDHETAVILLEIESEMLGMNQSISKLQNRCLNVLASKWKFLCEQDPETTVELCTKLPPFIVSELMIRSLLYAKDSASKSVAVSKSSNRSINSGSVASTADDDSSDKTPSRKRSDLARSRNGSGSSSSLLKEDSSVQSKNSKGKEPSRAKGSQLQSGQGSSALPKKSRNRIENDSQIDSIDMKDDSSKQSTNRRKDDGDVIKRTSSNSKIKSSDVALRNSSKESTEMDSLVRPKENGQVRKRVVDVLHRLKNRSNNSTKETADSDLAINDRSRSKKNDYEIEIDRLRRLCEQKDQQLNLYKNELQKFRRLPNQPDGKLVKSGTKSVVTLPSAQLLGGVQHEKDGFLLSTYVNGSKKYPLFYFKDDSSFC